MSGGAEPGEVLSPWALRFGIVKNNPPLKEGQLRHSGYITDPLRTDPKFYADSVLPDQVPRILNDHNRYFYTRYMQTGRQPGIPQWSHGPLMQYIRFSDHGLIPGGHWRPESKPVAPLEPGLIIEDPVALTSIVETELIEVDEDSWFSFLRRDRWYDTIVRNTVPDGKRYSVDQPKVWRHLKFSLELMNRMLRALIHDQHPLMHTMIFGVLMYWKEGGEMQPIPEPFEGAKVLLSYPRYKQWCDAKGIECPVDHLANLSSDVWEAVLEDWLRPLMWGFEDQPDSVGITWHICNSVVSIHTQLLETLNSVDITPAERCQLQYLLAVTMIHELMHALVHFRVAQQFTPPDPDRPWYHGSEPFMDYDPIAEMGFAVESRLFGGVATPIDSDTQIPLGLHMRFWPNPGQEDGQTILGLMLDQHPAVAGIRNVTTAPISALYTSKLLSRSFWDDKTILRKSDNFFHRNQVIFSTTAFNPGVTSSLDPFKVDYANFAINGDEPGKKALDPGEREMIKSWEHWEAMWVKAHESWHNQALEIWSSSPWVRIGPWDNLFQFARDFELGDEVDCASACDRMISVIDWKVDIEKYAQALLSPGFDWIVHCIGLLMMASLPIRRERVEFYVQARPLIGPQFIPSSRNPSKDILETLVARTPDRMVHRSCEPSQFYNPILNEMEANKPISDFEHKDILENVRIIVRFMIESGKVVSGPWLKEIVRVLDNLVNEREEMKKDDPKYHLRLWASYWDFKVPDYAPNENYRWDERIMELQLVLPPIPTGPQVAPT